MQKAGLDEAQAGSNIAGRNINNLRYADDTILMPESKEELKSLLMKMNEASEKDGLKFNIKKTKIMASSPVFLRGESQGRGSLVGCRLWGHTDSDTTEAT